MPQPRQVSPADADSRRSNVAEGIVSAQTESSRQQDDIRQLTAENDRLKKEIAAVTGVPYDYVKADKYATLKGEVDALERRYQFEKMKKNELTKKYQLARIDLLQSRRLKGGVNAEKEHAEAVQRQVEILENRLDQALTKFNDSISYNKELRDHIDIIREERRVFQRVYKRMEDELTSKKKLMAERIEESNRDLDERDEYQRQVEQLRQAIREQKQGYDTSVRETDEAMVEVKEMREEQQRLQLELEAREYEFNNDAENAGGPGANLSPGRHRPLEDRPGGPTHNAEAMIMDDAFGASDAPDAPRETEPDLKDVLQQLRDYTQETDLHVLARQYERLGEANFSLYKRVNELTTSNGEVSAEIRRLRAWMEEERAGEARQRVLIKSLEGRLAETEERLEGMRGSVAQHRDALAHVRAVTEEAAARVGCAVSPARLGGTTRCTESNHLQFLGLLEERAGCVVCAFQQRGRGDARRPSTPDASRTPTPDAEQTQKETPTTKEIHPGKETAGKENAGKENAPPVVPVFSNTPMARDGVSATRLVRQACLPSAHIGGEEGTDVVEEWSGDPVVSHEEVRRQMEQRLMAKREREERAQRRKKDLKEQLTAPVSPRRK